MSHHLAEIDGPLATVDVSAFRGPRWLLQEGQKTRECIRLQVRHDSITLSHSEVEDLLEVLVRWHGRAGRKKR